MQMHIEQRANGEIVKSAEGDGQLIFRLHQLKDRYDVEMAKEEVRCMDEMVDKAFADEFRAFLVAQGPRRNMDTYQSGHANAKPLYRKQPVSTHPTVIEFLDKHIDAEQEFKTDLAKLIARYEKTGSLANASLHECWMYYKFVVQGMNPTQLDYDRWADMRQDLEDNAYRVTPRSSGKYFVPPRAPAPAVLAAAAAAPAPPAAKRGPGRPRREVSAAQ